MHAKYLTIALIAACGLAPLAWAEGDTTDAAAKTKQSAAALPEEKMTERQWKVLPAFFERNGSTEEKPNPILFLEEKGVIFPAGATARYSSKKQILTVKNTVPNLEIVDATVKFFMDLYRPVGRTAEDFKKWAKEEYRRRQAAVKLMEKVDDTKSAQKALDKLMKIYKAKKDVNLGPLGNLMSIYRGSLNVIDRKTRDAVGKKFAKQLGDIYEQQRRLEGLDLQWSPGMEGLIWYTACIDGFAEDDRTYERWELTENGIKVVKEEEDSSEVSETSSELPDNENESRK